jgi:hypothetical protein
MKKTDTLGIRGTMAKKKYEINLKQLENLAQFGCTNLEIAQFFGCDESTIRKGYSEILTKGRSQQKLRLRQLQWRSAESGNVTMQIWLGKQILGQAETPITTDNEPLPWSN